MFITLSLCTDIQISSDDKKFENDDGNKFNLIYVCLHSGNSFTKCFNFLPTEVAFVSSFALLVNLGLKTNY